MKACMMLMTPGPRITTNSAGKRQNSVGNRILMGTFWACSSARCRRRIRISFACSRSTCPTGTPRSDACTTDEAKPRSSGIEVRLAIARSASERDLPMRISWSTRAASPAIGPPAVAGDLGQRPVEALSGLDADGQGVQDVGQGGPQAVLALDADVVDGEVGAE